MILRNITWIHSLIRIEVIKRCCSIHVFGNSFILILYNIIIFTYSNIHCLITLICLIIIISHTVKLLLICKFYCFCPGAHISFKYARYNHLRCPMMGEYLQKRSLIKHTCSWRVNLLQFEHWKYKQKDFYVYDLFYF